MKMLALAALLGITLTSAPSAGAAGVPGFAGCRGYFAARPKLVVRPGSIVFACGDDNFYATGIRWPVWTRLAATGTGIAHLNDCDPYCAAGQFHAYRLELRLSRPRPCPGPEHLAFTRAALNYPSEKPAGPRRYALTFPCG